jgi:hypothetical protein
MEGGFRIYDQNPEAMIVYHKNNEIDREQWDNCIRNTPGARPYAYSWYLDIMAPGWQALVDDDYDSVFPVPGFSRFGIQYIATPVFLQQLGAFSPDNHSTKAVTEFLNYMPDFYKFVDLCIGQKIDISGYKISEKVNFELDLSKPYETISGNFSDHCRRNIHSSSRNCQDLVSEITPDEIINLFIENKGKEIDGIKDRDYQRLKSLINFCKINKKGRIIGVKGSRKKLIFGLFIVEIHGRKTILLVANTPQSRDKRIGYYVVNELIKDNSSTKTILDFAGSSIPSIASFYESFGSAKVPYYRLYRNSLFWPARLLK